MNKSHERSIGHLMFASGLILFGLGVFGLLSSTLNNSTQIIFSIIAIIIGGIFTAIGDFVNVKLQKVKSVE